MIPPSMLSALSAQRSATITDALTDADHGNLFDLGFDDSPSCFKLFSMDIIWS